MLINCPKCNFSQPKDRYCASCGVDMDSFRPAPPSLSSKFWNNPTAPLGLTLAVAIGSFWYIRHQFRMADAPVTETGRYVRMKSNDAPAPAPGVPTDDANEVVPPPPPAVEPMTDGAPATAQSAPVGDALPASENMRSFAAGPEAVDNGATAADDAAIVVGSFPLRFTFVEIPKALLERLLEEQRKAGPNGLDQAQLQKLWEAVRKNPESELNSVSYPFQSNRLAMKRNISGEGEATDNGEAGLRLDADVNVRAPASTGGATGTPSLLTGSLQLNAHLRLEEAGNLHSKEKALSGNFSFKPGNAWIYHVDLPRGPVGETVAPTGVHRVFLSQGFKNRETEVTLIVELDKQSDYY